MPVYADQLTRGRGKYAARLVLEGWPYIFVTDRRLVRTLADGREQIVGLQGESIRIAARLDLIRGELREQEMTAELADVRDATVRQLLTHALHRTPTVRTWLLEELDVAETTEAVVSSVGGLASSGVVHIGTEAIAYSGVDTSGARPKLTGLTRGYWGTIAQTHPIGSGDSIRYPPVTDLPTVLRGRRIKLYLYGSGDDSSGDGTLRWRGVCRTDLDYEPPTWTFGIEPLSRVLEQQIGGDLDEPVPIRGIYLPSDEAFVGTFTLHSGAAHTSATTSDSAEIARSGFWDDNYDLADDLQSEIDTAASAWSWESGAELRVEALGSGGYRFVYRTGPTTAHYLTIKGPGRTESDGVTLVSDGLSPVDLFTSMLDDAGQWLDDAGAAAETLDPARTYTMEIAAPVPRTYFGRSSGYSSLFRDRTGDHYPPRRLYLGSTVTPSMEMAGRVVGRDEDDDDVISEAVAVSEPDRWIQLGGGISGPLGPRQGVQLIRVLARGHVGDLIDAIIADSPATANAGAMPLVGSDDWDTDWAELEDSIAGLGVGADRLFLLAEGTTLGKYLAEELKLIGCHLSLTATGQLAIRRLGLVTTTASSTRTLDSRTIKGGRPRATRIPEGMLHEVLIRQGWDPVEGEHRGLTVRNRNTTGSGEGVLEIAPMSKTGGITFSFDDPLEVSPEQARLLSQTVLAIFGEAYSIWTMEAGLERFDLVLGEAALVTSPMLPAADGTLGVVQQPAQVIGYDWSLFEGKGSIDLMAHARRIAGYAPAGKITGQTDNGGDEWELAISVGDYTADDLSDWFDAGNKIRITERDTLRPAQVSGTVVSVTDPSTMVVQLDTTWTPGSDEWRLGYDTADVVNVTPAAGRRWAQSEFAFVADDERRLAFSSGDEGAYEFAP